MGQRCVIFDIDGTLADCTHRLHFVKHGKRDWDGFFAAMGADGVIEPVRELLWAVARGDLPIVICTGRPEKYRGVTQNWLGRNGIGYDLLYMRPDGDFRADHIVKKQILDGMRADGFDPFLVIDDRQSVVDMWRENGLVCLQAAPERPEIPETAILSLMVGPSGGGKSTWLGSEQALSWGIYPEHVISSDVFRRDVCGNFKDQTKNDEVFDAVHAVAKARLLHGLPTVIDATHLRRKDRMTSAGLVGLEVPVRYFVVDRPEADKRATGGWRNELGFDLIAKHAQTFGSQIKDILAGDHLANVTVVDLRQ
jgi:predicted kinase